LTRLPEIVAIELTAASGMECLTSGGCILQGIASFFGVWLGDSHYLVLFCSFDSKWFTI
jgi:hypothetical protein